MIIGMHTETRPGPRALLLCNLRAVGRNYLDSGVRRLVPAGVAQSREDRLRYEDAVGIGLSVCRLRVELPTMRERLARRHGEDPEGLRRHLDRSGELDGILERARVEDFVVDATATPVPATAEAVLRAAGWQ